MLLVLFVVSDLECAAHLCHRLTVADTRSYRAVLEQLVHGKHGLHDQFLSIGLIRLGEFRWGKGHIAYFQFRICHF